MPTSGVVVVRSRWGPSASRANVPLWVTKDAVDTSTKRSHDEGAASLNANQVLMLHSRLKIIQARSVAHSSGSALTSHILHK